MLKLRFLSFSSHQRVFCSILLAGVPQYGLVVHPQKVVVNFQAGSSDSFPDIRVLPPHCLFPWCGLLLDTHSLDVSKDYSRWSIPPLPAPPPPPQLPGSAEFPFARSYWADFIVPCLRRKPNNPTVLCTHSLTNAHEVWQNLIIFLVFFQTFQFCRAVCSLQPESGLFSLCRTTDEEKTHVHPQTQVPFRVYGPKGQEKGVLINIYFWKKKHFICIEPEVICVGSFKLLNLEVIVNGEVMIAKRLLQVCPLWCHIQALITSLKPFPRLALSVCQTPQ